MVYPIYYRRPKYMATFSYSSSSSDSDSDRRHSYRNGKKESSLRSGNSGIINGIPEALSFDRIINGGTCPVSTIFTYSYLFDVFSLLSKKSPSHAVVLTPVLGFSAASHDNPASFQFYVLPTDKSIANDCS